MCVWRLAVSGNILDDPERLFRWFDSKATGTVDYEEFIRGMAICCRGTPAEKADFIFSIYDLSGCVAEAAVAVGEAWCQLPREKEKRLMPLFR